MTTPDEYMHWYITDDNLMKESNCIQFYGEGGSGNAGNTTRQEGRRHFDDYDAETAQDDATYAFPDDEFNKDDCIEAQQEHLEILEKMKSFYWF